MTLTQGTNVALLLVAQYGLAPCTPAMQRSRGTGTVGKAELGPKYLPAPNINTKSYSPKYPLSEKWILSRAFLTREVDGQQTVGVKAGAGFPERAEVNMITLETSEEGQRFSKDVREVCISFCRPEKYNGHRDIKTVEAITLSL